MPTLAGETQTPHESIATPGPCTCGWVNQAGARSILVGAYPRLIRELAAAGKVRTMVPPGGRRPVYSVADLLALRDEAARRN